MKIKEIPQSERPYEKLEMYGAQALSNAELLAIIIKNGTKEESSVMLAQKILSMQKSTQDSLRFLQDISIKEFMSIKGIGKVKAIQLLAVCELTKRISRPIKNFNVQIKSPQDVADLLINELKYEKREIVKVLMLNAKNNILKIQDIALGGTSFAVFEIKDVLKEAIKIGAPKIILVHNHPSGDPTPSHDDIELTQKLEQVSKMLEIELLDHVVIGDGKYKSIFSMLNKNKGNLN
ncbi:MAG: DNA repair protein RadC [Clostridia bacterium]|jgi:DNA repair protein RadC